MSDGPLLPSGPVHEAYVALRRDLLAEGGPRISTMRNYRYAIWLYPSEREFELRRAVARLCAELTDLGWSTLDLSMQRLLLDRVAALGEPERAAIVARERRFAVDRREPERGLQHLRDQLGRHLNEPGGLPADVARAVTDFIAPDPDAQERSVVFLSRLGALHPFLRVSSLLQHIAGKTQQVPVVLLYPGTRDDKGLSLFGEMPAASDYRPRIYP